MRLRVTVESNGEGESLKDMFVMLSNCLGMRWILEQWEPEGPGELSKIGSPWRKRSGVLERSIAEHYVIALRFSTGIFTGRLKLYSA